MPPWTGDGPTGDTDHSTPPQKEAGGFNQGLNKLTIPQTEGCGSARAVAARVGEANKDK